MAVRALYAVSIFLSAFLLFQVQPIVGKYILPWFGSSPGVWTTCLLFFQVVLVGGYTYAHFVVSRLRPARQAQIHGALLVLALLTLPITPDTTWKPHGDEAPTGRILLVLLSSVGLPYLLLSSTGPLLQGWAARLHPDKSPYRLYALSNVGSLLALVSYPFWVEPALSLHAQTSTWSWGYAGFAVLGGLCAWSLARGTRAADAATTRRSEATPRGFGALDVLLWFLLAACGSALLLATTNQLCLDVAVVPFLWIAPLCIYLLTFILTFDHPRWYVRSLFGALLPLALIAVVWLLRDGVDAKLDDQLLYFPAALFVFCMCCHGELARAKPAPEHLTFFFLVVSLGGAAGGLTIALGAPAWFSGFHELPLLLMVLSALMLFVVTRDALRGPRASDRWKFLKYVRLAFWGVAAALVLYGGFQVLMRTPLLEEDASESLTARLHAWIDTARWFVFAAPVLALAVFEAVRWQRRQPLGLGSPWCFALIVTMVGAFGLTALGTAVGWELRRGDARLVERERNFYGVLSVREYSPGTDFHDLTLQHGRITHGYQYTQAKRSTWPTTYYGPETGVGLAIRMHPHRETLGRPFRIGVVGLGAGTLAAYGNATVDPLNFDDYTLPRPREPGDELHFYEINPLVIDWADKHFTYLSEARTRGAKVDVYLGDARIVMERQLAAGAPKRLDVLAVDAFSSDAIPIHLLTREAFATYLEHLAPLGVLAIHVTNRYISLGPVVRRLAGELGLECVTIDSPKNTTYGVYSCDWMLLTRNRLLAVRLKSTEHVFVSEELGPLWTDDYSSVWPQVDFKDDD